MPTQNIFCLCHSLLNIFIQTRAGGIPAAATNSIIMRIIKINLSPSIKKKAKDARNHAAQNHLQHSYKRVE